LDALRLPMETGGAGRKSVLSNNRSVLLRNAGPWLAACAAIVVAVVSVALFFRTDMLDFTKRSGQQATPLFYETAIGRQKKITLADGSSVVLNTDSRMEVNFSGNRREVHLMRGEAYFDVVHDETRPFTVYANSYVVRDIGTAFDVHMSRGDVVEVNVTKGVVEFTPMTGAPVLDVAKKPRLITAGQNIVLSQHAEHQDAESGADMQRKLAWLQ